MNVALIFIWVILTFIIMAFLEKTIEGPNAWAKKSYGWKYKFTRRISLTEYHLTLNIFILMMGLLPLIIYGFNLKIFGVLLSAFMVGMVVEDFSYFIVNPYFGLRKFNAKDARWYPWLKFGEFEIPAGYIINVVIAILSWLILWR